MQIAQYRFSASRAPLERQVAAGEEIHRHVQRLLGVVIAFERVPRRQAVVRFDQVGQRLLHVRSRCRRHDFVAECRHIQHVEDEKAVVGDGRASALRDDVGMRHFGLVAHGLDVIHDVVRIFLKGVVHTRLEIGLRSVVVHAKAAADVEVFQARALLDQFDVNPCRLIHAALTIRIFVIWLPR